MSTAPNTEIEPAFENSLTLFQRILLTTDGTVTNLIAAYTGEKIQVEKLDQSLEPGIAPAGLRCEGAVPLLRRRILLRGENQPYVYADSVFVFERLSETIQSQLLTTDRPIGLMWKEERVESYREIVDLRIEPGMELAHHFSLPESTTFASRTYIVHQSGRPLGTITEKWPLCMFDRGPRT